MGEEEGDAADRVLPLRSEEGPEHGKAVVWPKTPAQAAVHGQPGVRAPMVRRPAAV